MASVISFLLNIFYPRTKLENSKLNENFSIIDSVLDEQTTRIDNLTPYLQPDGN